MFDDFLGYFDKHYFWSKTGVANFSAILEKNGLLFIPTSGHAGKLTQSSLNLLYGFSARIGSPVQTGSDCPSLLMA